MGRPKKIRTEEAPKKKPVVSETAPKKAAEGIGDSSFNIVGPVTVDGQVHLSRVDLAEFELVQSRVAALQSTEGLLRFQIIEERRVQDRKLTDMRARLIAETQEYERYKKELAIVYGVDFETVTYDDRTGLLRSVDTKLPLTR